MSEIDLGEKETDLESARRWLSRDRQDKFTKYFGNQLCDEVERLRARVKEFDREEMIGLCLGFCGVPNAGPGDPYYDDAAKRVEAMIKERNKE